ncbi:hypothetical protein C1H76_4343 [Elsinoe australis]|uniref:Uncharacterized protein n=1 Tax=Elsinoe australis TaxID=40998 RepID=A0A4U7B3D9_9PEZI|nr:hypothetical protein C1H76_4343 [Elsinoe australis]
MLRGACLPWQQRFYQSSSAGLGVRHYSARSPSIRKYAGNRRADRTPAQDIIDLPKAETTSHNGKLSRPLKLEIPYEFAPHLSRQDRPPSLQVSKIQIRRHSASRDDPRPRYQAVLDLQYEDDPHAKETLSADRAKTVTTVLNFLPNVLVDETSTTAKSLTVFSKSTENSLSDLVEQLVPLALPQTHGEPLFIILATPSYASELASNKDVVPSILSKLLPESPESESMKSCQTLVAIVDKLPTRTPVPENVSNARNAKYRSGKVMCEDNGMEGLTIAVSTSTHFFANDLAVDNWSTESTRFTHSLEGDKPSTITFSMNPDHGEVLQDLLSRPDLEDPTAVRSYSVQLPLATTIFQNGMRSTLLHGRYTKGNNSNQFACLSRRQIQNAQVALTTSPGVGASNAMALSMPLLKLTNSRKVATCMGNIVREMGPPHDILKQASQPASQQLESAVAQYFKAAGIAPHAMSVWALIIPKHLAQANGTDAQDLATSLTPVIEHEGELPDSELFWKHPGSPWLGLKEDQRLGDLFAHGVKLCKVTSGGGGWGNKAGLLSFDPDTSFESTTAPFAESLLGPDFDDNSKPTSGLKEIAEEGDLVQFHFVPDSVLNPVDPAARPQILRTRSGEQSVEFGVVPSTIDEQTMEDGQSSTDEGQKTTALVNHFGALSERGLSMRIKTFEMSTGIVRPQEKETKIDVPFSRFSIRHLSSAPIVRQQPSGPRSKKPAQAQETERGDGLVSQRGNNEDAMFDAVFKATVEHYQDTHNRTGQSVGEKTAEGANKSRDDDQGRITKQTMNFRPTSPRRQALSIRRLPASSKDVDDLQSSEPISPSKKKGRKSSSSEHQSPQKSKPGVQKTDRERKLRDAQVDPSFIRGEFEVWPRDPNFHAAKNPAKRGIRETVLRKKLRGSFRDAVKTESQRLEQLSDEQLIEEMQHLDIPTTRKNTKPEKMAKLSSKAKRHARREMQIHLKRMYERHLVTKKGQEGFQVPVLSPEQKKQKEAKETRIDKLMMKLNTAIAGPRLRKHRLRHRSDPIIKKHDYVRHKWFFRHLRPSRVRTHASLRVQKYAWPERGRPYPKRSKVRKQRRTDPVGGPDRDMQASEREAAARKRREERLHGTEKGAQDALSAFLSEQEDGTVSAAGREARHRQRNKLGAKRRPGQGPVRRQFSEPDPDSEKARVERFNSRFRLARRHHARKALGFGAMKDEGRGVSSASGAGDTDAEGEKQRSEERLARAIKELAEAWKGRAGDGKGGL